jgi:hypothetical protein
MHTRALVAGAALLISLACASSASAALPTSVTMLGAPSEGPTTGYGDLETPSDAAISATLAGGTLTVTSTTVHQDTSRYDFYAPAGQDLTTGVYDGAAPEQYRVAGRPAMEIGHFWSQASCDGGRFEIKDLAAAPDGTVQRLLLVLQSRCDSDDPGLFGEIRINEPADGDLAPGIVRFPEGDLGGETSTDAVPVTLVASAAGPVGAASIDGPGASSFSIYRDDCAGKTLAAGDRCQVWIRNVPATTGTLLATLHVGASSAALQGYAHGGVSDLQMHSDPGDWVGSGNDYAFHAFDPTVSYVAGGTPTEFSFDVNSRTVEFDGDFHAYGVPFATGTRSGTNQPNTSANFLLEGDGHGCNRTTWSTTIRELSFDADGFLVSLDADFVQHCGNATPAMSGTVRWRAGDTTPPAPWMAASTAIESPPATSTTPAVSTPTPAAASSGALPAAHTVAPSAPPTLTPAARQHRLTVARRGLLVRGRATTPMTVKLTVSSRTARALRLHSRTIGTAHIARPGAFTVRIPLTRAVRRHRLTITVAAMGARAATVVVTS